jgi:transposase
MFKLSCPSSWAKATRSFWLSCLLADPLSGHLFIFRNKTVDRVKVLYWGGHGLCLWCQRLEAGRYHFPEAANATDAGIELSATQFAMILDGIDLSGVCRFKRFTLATPISS